MGASNFLHNKAQERAKKIDSKYGEGAYGGTLWQSQMQNASSYSQDNVSESGSFLQRKIAQRQAAKTNTPSSNASYKKEYGTNVSTSGIYSQPVLSATEYQKEIDRLTNEKSDYSKKWREEYISKFIAGDEEWNKYQNALKDYDRQIEEMKAGKWKAEKSAKYGNLSSNADYAEKSKVIDKTLGTTFGVTIGDNFYGIGDDVYAYVNDIGKRQSLSKFSGNTGDAGMYKYSYMTQQEKDNYNYLYQTEGKKSANDYLDYISYDLDARRTKDLSGQWSEFADKHPVAASALSVPSNLMSGIGLADVAVQNIERSISGEYKPINYNSVGMNATNMTTAIRGTVSQNLADEYGTININSEEHPIFARILNGKSLGDVYQLGMSMVDSAATAAIGSVTGIGAFGTILLGGSAGSQGVLTALEKGATDEQALAMGLLNGTFEALFEFVSINKLLKGNTKSILKAFFEQGFVEGTEELNTTLFNTIADICVMAENSDYQNMIKSYLEKGYSQKDAERMAMQDIAIGMGWDFIGGAISGGIMGGGKTAINNTIIEPHYYSNTYGQSVQELVSESLEINPGNKLASEIKSKLDSNKNVSGRKIMQLVNQNESDMVSNDKAAIQKAAARQLTSYGETGDVNKIAQAITKQVSGEKLTQSDRSLISQSKYGQRVANELNAENINSGEYNTSWAETLGTSRINTEEYSRLLQEANNEPQSDSAQQQSVYTAPAENAQQAQPVSQREAVQDAEKEPAAETASQESNAEAPSTVGAAAIAEAAAEDVSSNDYGSAIKAASVKYGAQAGAFVHTYQPGQDVKKYDEAYRTAYDMGKSGVPMRTVKSMGSVSYLTDAQREYAYEAGQAASDAEAKAQEARNASGNKRNTARRKGTVKGEGVRISDLKKTFNDPQNKSYRILTKFAEATGIDIVLYNSQANENGDFTAANGRFSWREDKIYIDINAGLSTINDVGSLEKYTMLRTFSHEFLHFLEKWNPVQYNEFRRVVFDAMNEKLSLKNADSETKITLDDIINERMDKWNKGIDKMNEGKAESEKAPHVTYEQASREVVAEAMTDILPDSSFMEEMYNNHRNLFTKIVEKLKEFLADLKAYFSGITPNNRMEAALLKEDVGGTIRYMQSIVDAFDKLALGGVENYQQAQAEQELTNAGIIVDNSTDSASINSYSVRYLLDDKQKEKVTASLVKRFGVTKEEAANWLTAETSIASLVLNPKYSQYLDYEADPDEVAIKTNSDYPQGTVDFSPICKKRREFTSVMNAVFRKFPNHVFAATDLAKIRTIMGEEGMTLPCGICYVEDRRQLDSIVAQDFLNGLKLYREGSTTRPDGKPFNTNQLRGLRYTDGDSYVPTIAELITLDGQNELKKKNPNMSEAWRRYNNARGMQSVRRLANEAEYKRQILKYSQKTVKSKNGNGGLRIYSFSDAEMFHLIDIIQIITDSSSVGLCLQGYTKVNEYAKAVRNTGEKLNRSLIPLGDLGYHMENGKVVLDFDTVEGIDINDPAFFDNSDNPDVGNIVIGINDTQIRAAMVSPFIDQIIPFHTGQSEEVLKEKNIDAWDNYKDYQTEKDISTGKKSKHQINIYTEVIQVLEAEGKAINKRTFVEKFLQVCKENGLTPRFAQFLNTDANGDYVYTEGYHKMLVDFKTFAQTETGEYLPQMPVKPVFDDAYLGEILKAYVEEQTAKDSRVARSMPKVVERIANEIIQTSDSYQKDQYEIRDRETKAFQSDIDDWIRNGRSNEEKFVLGYTGDVLQGLGAIENDIYMNGDKINTILSEHEEMSIDVIKKIPEILNDPALVLKSKNVGRGNSQNSRLVMFGSVKAKNGQPVMAILDLRPVENGFVVDDMQKVNSTYTKDNAPVEFIRSSDVLYADKKRTTLILRTVGFQMPIELIQSGYIGSISYRGQNVNIQGKRFSDLVRIKKRGPTSSESSAPIAVDYAGVTSAEEAADQTAMASYADSITPDGKNSQEQNQVRESNLSDADVLVIAAEAVKNNDERYNWLTAGEKDALNIFLKKATTLKEAQQRRYELLDRKRWLMDNKDTRQRGELAKVQNNLDTVNAQIRRAQDEILKVENQKVIRKVLKQARRVVERDSLQRGLEELQAYKNKRNDTEAARKYRKRVVDTAMEMSEWLRKNSDKEHVPEILKKPVLELLTSIDFSSKRFLRGGELTKADKKFGANLAELQKLLNGQQGAIEGEEAAVDNIGAYLDISVENRQFLNDIVNTLASVDGTFTINKMTADELKSFSRFLSNLATAIRKANKTLANARYQNIPDMAQSSMRHMEEMGNAPAADGTPTAKFLKWTNTTPYYAFKRFGEAGEALFDGFTRGWEKLAFNAQEIIDFTNKTYTAKEIRKWRSEIHDITLEDGRTVQMTTAQIMELSQLLNREQARKHIEAGGIRIGNINGKPSKVNGVEHYHFTVNDLKNVVGLLNDRQLQVAVELRRYMGKRGGEWGNEISMARFGYQFYTEGENYYTIRTDANGRPLRDTDEQTNSMFRLLNLSSSKSLNPNANNALIVSDIFDTFADHMADMAKLNALGLPLLDAIKWYNYTERFNNSDGTMDEEGVKKSMEKAFGTAAGSYFRTLLKDINGVKESGDRGGNFASRMMSNYKVAAVGANLRVALLQPTSYVRAMYVLKPKNMIAALAFKKNAYKEAMQYSGTAVWKSLGYYDTDIAKSMRSQIEHDDTWLDKVKDKSLALVELGDQRTWGRLWVACKLEAKERNSSLTGEELCRATADIFREVIYATQVMDSTLTRSEMMRGSTRWTKLTTAFMAEPTLSLNILMDCASQVAIDKRKTNLKDALRKNQGKIALAVTTYVCSAAAAALMESIMDAFRDDDDYETFLDKFLQAFLGEEGFLDGNLGQDLTVIGNIPVLKDIISTIRGIKSSDMSLAAITSISNVYAIWKESIALANGTLDKATNVTWYGKMTDWGKIYKTLQALSQLTGVSISNMTRDVVAIWNTTVGSMTPGLKIKTYDPGEKNSIKYAYQDGYLTEEEAIDKLLSAGEAEDRNEAYWIVNEWSTGGSKYAAMKESIKANDSAAYNKAMSELTGHGVDEESALNEARKAIQESYASGEINDSQAVSYLQKYGGKEEDKARESVELWKFKAASDEYDDITAAAVAKYNEYCAGTGMSKDTYYKAWSVIKDIRGEDRNGDGTNDAYSAMDKKLDYIGSLSISYDQKYALALASGISEKNIMNRANW